MSDASGIKVSIVTASYNRGYCIEHTIRSVLEQTHRNIEYIVVDDGSTDRTREVVESFRDPRMKFVRHDTNETHAARYPQTLKTCTGDYIMRLDSDDRLISPTVIETMIRNMTSSGPREILHGYSWIDGKTQKNVNYFTGWADGRTEITFEDFLLGTKGYADILWIAKREFIDNFYKYYTGPFNWFTGLWEALQPDGKLIIFQEPMGIAGWGGTDNVSVFSHGGKLWGMCADYNEYLATRYSHILAQKPKRLGYFHQWAGYYDVLLNRRTKALKNLIRAIRHDFWNIRSWLLLLLLPLPYDLVNWILHWRSRIKWTYRKRGDWRT